MRGTNPRHFVRQPVAQSHRAVKTKYVDGYFKKEQMVKVNFYHHTIIMLTSRKLRNTKNILKRFIFRLF